MMKKKSINMFLKVDNLVFNGMKRQNGGHVTQNKFMIKFTTSSLKIITAL